MNIRFENEASFNKALNKFAKKSKIAPGRIATSVAFTAFGGDRKGVVGRTPVRTGWARASWNIAEGAADLTVPAKPAKGVVLPAPVAIPPAITPEFPTWYITNNLRYITELEAGKSIQMDKGYMVQRTLVELEAEINAELRRLA